MALHRSLISCVCWSLSLWAATTAPNAALAAMQSREVFISTDGNDSNPGTKARPLANLDAARDLIRSWKSAASVAAVTVWLEPGEYPLTHTFQLTEKDSGSAEAPIIYRSIPGKTVRLIGARRLSAGDFHVVTDAKTLERVAESARGKVVELDLSKLGAKHSKPYPDLFTDVGGTLDLFFDDHRMSLSRYPNDGFMTMQRVLKNGGPGKHDGGVFQYRQEDQAHFQSWMKELDRGVWLKGYWRVMWQNEAARLKSIDPASRTAAFISPVPGGIGNKYHRPEGNGKEEYWLLNLLEEVDQPGEWCVDFQDQKLYFYPPAPLDSGEICLADSDGPIIQLSNASHVTLRGLLLEDCRNDGILVQGGEADLIAGCIVRNIDKYAVVLDGGTRHVVQSCDLYDLGAGGVWLGGGDEKSTPRVAAGHQVINNHIHHFSELERVYTPGVNCGFTGGGGGGHHPAVGMLVAHNLIHDSPHGAVLFGSWDSIFEYNEVFRYCTVSDDLGAFYCYDSYKLDGNQTIRYNLMHDTDDGDGIYFDNDHRDMHIYGNIAALKSLPNRRGTGFLYKIGSQAKNPQSIECFNNIAVNCNVGFQFVSALTKEGRIENNISVSCKTPWIWKAVQDGKQVSLTADFASGKNVSYDVDPGFADMSQLDFHLKSDSRIHQDLPSFQPIPVDKIGLYLDEYRTSLPTADETDRFGKRTTRSPQGYEVEDRK